MLFVVDCHLLLVIVHHLGLLLAALFLNQRRMFCNLREVVAVASAVAGVVHDHGVLDLAHEALALLARGGSATLLRYEASISRYRLH